MERSWRTFALGLVSGMLLITGFGLLFDGLDHGGYSAVVAAAQKYLLGNVTLAALISAVLLFTGGRRDRLSLTTTLNKQIQDYNLAILKDRELAGLQSHGQLANRSDTWIQDLHQVFYVLNMIRDGRLLQQSGFAYQHHLFEEDEMIVMLAEDFPDQLDYVLHGQRGYSPKFKTAMLGILDDHLGSDWAVKLKAAAAARPAVS